jgi:hypothetical protein
MEASDYDEIPLFEALYFVRGLGLQAERKRWGCTVDQKMVLVQRSPCARTLVILFFNKKSVSTNSLTAGKVLNL